MLTARGPLQEVRCLQMELANPNNDNELLTKTAEALSSKTPVPAKQACCSTYTPAESIEPEHIGVVIDVGRKVSA